MIRVDADHVAVQTSEGRKVVRLPIEPSADVSASPLTERLGGQPATGVSATPLSDRLRAKQNERSTVHVHPMDIGLAEGQEPTEWFAECTEADWSRGGQSCNWYGPYRSSEAEAREDAERHQHSPVKAAR